MTTGRPPYTDNVTLPDVLLVAGHIATPLAEHLEELVVERLRRALLI